MQENPDNPPLRRLRPAYVSLLVLALVLLAMSLFLLPRPAGRDTRPPAPIAHPQTALPQRTLTIARKDGRVLPFVVEMAKTEEEKETGLMFRTEMPENQGMLFLFPNEAPRAMWMKNTLIPLDMLFIDAQGKIVSIVQRAEPESETIRESGGPASQVLELRGGTAEAYDIQAGDRIRLTDGAPGTLPLSAQPRP